MIKRSVPNRISIGAVAAATILVGCAPQDDVVSRSAGGAESPSVSKGFALNNGDFLAKDEFIESPNRKYRLIFQDGSTLQVIQSETHDRSWSSFEVENADRAVMRNNNLSILSGASNRMEWTSETKDLATPETGDLRVSVTDGGQVEISGTGGDRKTVWVNGAATVTRSTLMRGVLQIGQYLQSRNGAYRLSVVGGRTPGRGATLPAVTCNLKLTGPDAHWETGPVVCNRYALMNGRDLTIPAGRWGTGWSSQTSGSVSATTGPLQVAVTDGGRVQIRGTETGNQIVWQNGVPIR